MMHHKLKPLGAAQLQHVKGASSPTERVGYDTANGWIHGWNASQRAGADLANGKTLRGGGGFSGPLFRTVGAGLAATYGPQIGAALRFGGGTAREIARKLPSPARWFGPKDE